jgi:squalene-associated FAD-dependent desaturase
MSRGLRERRVAVVGGGLAGLAAAQALAEAGVPVELHEARRRLGGRASSWRDPAGGELVDFCQHVGMACCTNWLEFCRRAGLDRMLRRDRVITFFGPDGRRSELCGSRWLPAPLHLANSMLGMTILSLGDRFRIVQALIRLAARPADEDDSQTIGRWLLDHRQSPAAIERFWGPVLVSALGESLDRASLRYARKVFVDGFFANRTAYEIIVPTVALGDLYGRQLIESLRTAGVDVRLESAVERITQDEQGVALRTADGPPRSFDAVVAAVTWRRAADLLEDFRPAWPAIDTWRRFGAAPISGVHLWFDRELTNLPHAVLVGTLAQWLFVRGAAGDETFYHQVVISASHDLATMDPMAVVSRVFDELKQVFPAAREARLVRSKIVTEREAVFSVRPGFDRVRPAQTTPIPGLFLAGDWTATGWPATMESAVRSGYLAAERVLESFGEKRRIVLDDLPRGWLARRMIG